VLAGMLVLAAAAQPAVIVERMGFKVADAFEPQAAVSGELRIPASSRERLPAVLILHGSAGIDGRGASYAEALNAAGIATLEIDLFQGRGRPATTRHNMPHAFESLQWLAAHPRIDGARVGVMGFSWGAVMSLLSASEEVARHHGAGRRFAAHLALYPVCWTQRGVLSRGTPHYPKGTYQRLTGSPVHILAGDKDDYDAPGNCTRFVAELPDAARAHVTLTVYEGATHGWDSGSGGEYHDIVAHDGKGGTVRVVADTAMASRSRAFAVSFFRRYLAQGLASGEPTSARGIGPSWDPSTRCAGRAPA